MRDRTIVMSGRLLGGLPLFVGVWAAVLLLGMAVGLHAEQTMMLERIPEGYTLQYYDDCGVPGRQPHVTPQTGFTFSPHSVNAPLKERTVAYGRPDLTAEYTELKPGTPYVLAVTYASERQMRRVQRLYANNTQLHASHQLPAGGSERLLFLLPPQVIGDGRLVLRFVKEEGHNPVVSVIELWAPLPRREALHLDVFPSGPGKITAQVRDIAYEPVTDAGVTVIDVATGNKLAKATSGADGCITADLSDSLGALSNGSIEVDVRSDGLEAQKRLDVSELLFIPPKYRPIPTSVVHVSRQQMSLDGKWRIHTSPNSDAPQLDLRDAGWKDFRVPGQFLQQGYDVPDDATVALARRFRLPADWSGKRVILRFDAVHAGVRYWLNGVPLGDSENLFTPVDFDVTDAVRSTGWNILMLAMTPGTDSERISNASSYAFHSLAGIPRSVRLFALPQVHLSRVHLQTPLDANYRNAVLRVDLSVDNPKRLPLDGWSVRLQLKDPKGQSVPLQQPLSQIAGGNQAEHRITLVNPVVDPLKWSAEKPHLYELIIDLLHHDELTSRIIRPVGFRQVEARGREVLINGQAVKFAGICRHEIDPRTGRAGTAKHALTDARLFKEANVNYIRTSHYPPTEEFLDACDRLGIYVEVEAPFCWTRHNIADESDPSLTRAFAVPVSSMIEYHRNHPSVVWWSLANESGVGAGDDNVLHLNYRVALEICRRDDPSRLTCFNNESAMDGGLCDIAILHYPPMPADNNPHIVDDPRPVLLDEYFHLPCYEKGDLDVDPGIRELWGARQNQPNSHWNSIQQSKNIIGGAIWAGIDERFEFADGSVKGYGEWGIIDGLRRQKPEFWHCKRIYSPVWIPIREVEWRDGFRSVNVPVENRYGFTNLSELTCRWELAGKRGMVRLNVAPMSSRGIEIPVPAAAKPGDMLILRFYNARRQLITAHGVRLGARPVETLSSPGGGAPRWNDDGHVVHIQGAGFRLTLDKRTGTFQSGQAHTTLPIRALPTVHVAQTDERAPWNIGGRQYAVYPDTGSRVVESVTVRDDGGAIAITMHERYTDFSGRVEWILDRTGTGTVSFDYVYMGERIAVREAGLWLPMDPRCQTITWDRHSEWDVYPDDHIGRPSGTAHAAIDPTKAKVSWMRDGNSMGSSDFRATKYRIYRATLRNTAGAGVNVQAQADVDVRVAQSADSVNMYLLLHGPKPLVSGERLSGTFHVQLLP